MWYDKKYIAYMHSGKKFLAVKLGILCLLLSPLCVIFVTPNRSYGLGLDAQ